MTRRLLLVLLAALFAVAFVGASPAYAHNTLLTTDPADGAQLDVAPTSVVFVFANAVPLDTVSVDLIDAAGVRSELTQIGTGPAGDTSVVATLPQLPPGEVNIRWRLVGPDGHPITGRVGFVVTGTAAVATTIPGSLTSSSPLPAANVPSGGASVAFEEPWRASDVARWVLRALSYVAMLVLAGVVTAAGWLWPAGWRLDAMRRLALASLATIAVLAAAQLLVVAGDISGRPPWSSLTELSAALATDAGLAFAVRLLLVAGLAWVMFASELSSEPARWAAAGGGVLGLLGTWAYAGHAKSMRWSTFGVPLDVVHHGAAAAWLGAMIVVGAFGLRNSDREEMVAVVQRFGRLATGAVVVLTVSGILQSIRLVGSLGNLLTVDHGRFLAVKIAVLALMLAVADINRRRVDRRFRRSATATPGIVWALRRAMGTEFAVGMAVIGVTAAMVVSPPAVSAQFTAAATLGSTESVAPVYERRLRSETAVATLAVEPTMVGTNRLSIVPELPSPTTGVTIVASLIGTPSTTVTVPLQAEGAEWAAAVPFSASGSWRIEIQLAGAEATPLIATVAIAP